MRQALGPGALGRPGGIRWRGRWEGGSGWGTHVNPWMIHGFISMYDKTHYNKKKKKKIFVADRSHVLFLLKFKN